MVAGGYDNLAVYFNVVAGARITTYGFLKNNRAVILDCYELSDFS